MTKVDAFAGASERIIGASQGILLGLLSLVTVAAVALLAPVLPTIVGHFSQFDSAAEQKVLFAFSIPALMVAIFASPIGWVLDRIGRKLVLVVSLLVYGCVGMVPALMPEITLDQLLLSRIVLGIFEAAVMTSATTLIGDYYTGKDRQKWLILQTVFVSLSGIFFIGLGGFLGEMGWNVPFYAYGLFLIGVPFALFLLHEPQKGAEEAPAGAFPWRAVIGLYAFAFVVAIMFLIVPVQMPFVLNDLGVTSPQTIGLMTMANSIAIFVGSLCFRLRADASFKANLIGGLWVIALGTALLVIGGSVPMTLVGAVLSGLAAGFLLPCIVTQIMMHLPFELRGRGTGRFNAFYFLGNFLSPLIVLAIAGVIGGLSNALIAIAIVAAVIGLLGFALKSTETA